MKDKKTETAVATTVQTSIEVQHSTQVKKLAYEIISASGELAGKYLQLCLYIRKEGVTPKLVAYELKTLGFKKSRISEINRVAHASDKLFSEYQARLIGFDKCLELARVNTEGKPAEMTPAAKQLVADNSLTQDDVNEASKTPEQHTPSKAKTTSQKIKEHAKAICMLATRPATFKFTDCGFMVHVTKTNPQAKV